MSWPLHQRGKQPSGPCWYGGFEWEEGEGGVLERPRSLSQMSVSGHPVGLTYEPWGRGTAQKWEELLSGGLFVMHGDR